MVAGFLITRILLVFLWSELNYSSAFPRARSSMYPEAWQGVWEKRQEGHDNGNRRPLQYIQALMHPRRKPIVPDQVQVKRWQKPEGSSLRVRSHAQTQNQPSPYHQIQSPYQPQSAVATRWREEISPSLPPPLRNHSLFKPRSFEFSLKVPFDNFPGQNKETSSTTKGSDLYRGGSDGAGHYSQLYSPSGIQIYSNFNSPSGWDVSSDKGSTYYPIGGKIAHEDYKPSLQLSLSVPIFLHPTYLEPSSSNGDYLANLQRPGSDGFVQNSYKEPVKLQSSSTWSGSEGIFLNSASGVQQQTEHQMGEPINTKYTNAKLATFPLGHISQHTTPDEQISQGKTPNKQSQVFPKPTAPSLPIPQYPPVQSYNVHSKYYSAQNVPASNDYGEGQSGQMVSPDPKNVHLPLSPSQYERVPSGHYSAGQVKPNHGNNYGQRQTWQPVATQLAFASEQYNYGQFKPPIQNVETVPQKRLVHASPPTTATSQYKPPSVHQAATTNYYGTGNVELGIQMGQTEFSSSAPYQYSGGQSGQDAVSDHLTTFDPSPNFQGLSTDYQTQMGLPGQYNGRGQLDGKPKYTKLFIEVEDVMEGGDGQQNYFGDPPTHNDGYSGQMDWAEHGRDTHYQSS